MKTVPVVACTLSNHEVRCSGVQYLRINWLISPPYVALRDKFPLSGGDFSPRPAGTSHASRVYENSQFWFAATKNTQYYAELALIQSVSKQ